MVETIHARTNEKGYILPALIVLSLILMSTGLAVMQIISSATDTVQTQTHTNKAKEAANAGAALAYNCLRQTSRVDIIPW